MNGQRTTKIRPDEARAKGISTEHNEMPSGERRFRLTHDDGTAYIRTEATDRGGWQDSHCHPHGSRNRYRATGKDGFLPNWSTALSKTVHLDEAEIMRLDEK